MTTLDYITAGIIFIIICKLLGSLLVFIAERFDE